MSTDKPRIQEQRDVRDLVDLPRSAVGSHLYRAAEAMAPPNRPPESKFAPSALCEWIRSYLAYAFDRKHEFPSASASPQQAVYELGGNDGSEVRVSIAGDWGTGTDEAEAVSARMNEFKPVFTIHIGDVYYVGDAPEVNENCLGIKDPTNNYDPVTWPIGVRGSFALNGNHEMYANGNAYFDVFLPRLGLKSPEGRMLGQQTSFFCVENKYWRVIAIDTGYNSIGVPILSGIPLIKSIPGIDGNCKLRSELVDWIKTVVKPEIDQRGLVILSHHQYFSAFQNNYCKPAQQLWDAGIQRPVIWFWGHEHRLAGYDLYGSDKLKAYGRCVGHGGMPVDRGTPQHDPQPVFYDNRLSTNTFGVNGHVNIAFAANTLTATYVDLGGQALLEEAWEVSDGILRLIFQRKLTSDSDFHALR